MSDQDPLFFITENAKVSTFRLPPELSFLNAIAGWGNLPIVARHLMRTHFMPFATFKEDDLEHNKAVMKKIEIEVRRIVEAEASIVEEIRKRKNKASALQGMIVNDIPEKE